MSFLDCIKGKLEAGEIDKAQSKEITKKFNSLVESLKKSMPEDKAEIEASIAVLEREAEIKAHKRENLVRHAIMQEKIKDIIYSNAEKEIGVFSDNIGSDRKIDKATKKLMQSIDTRAETVNKQFISNLNQVAEEFKGDFASMFKTKEGFADIVRAILEPKSKPKDKAVDAAAQAFKQAFELAHKRYIQGGGIIPGKLDSYFPQTHNRELIRKVSFEDWQAELLPKLDRKKMIDWNTGKPFTDDALDAQMRRDFEGIVSNGISTKKQRFDKGEIYRPATEISERNAASRFYMFKDADSFLEYNSKFGNGDEGLIDMAFGHLNSLAKDVALLEKLGPKPKAMFKYIDALNEAEGVGGVRRRSTEGMFDILTGRTDSHASDASFFRIMDNVRNVQRSAYLGSATLSALPDTMFLVATSKLNGLPATKSLNNFVGLLNPMNKQHRKTAIDQGYIADLVSSSALSGSRIAGEMDDGKLTRWLAEATIRGSGLSWWTRASSDGITLTATATIGRLVNDNTPWNKLDDTLKNALEAFDITEADWQVVLKSELLDGLNGETKFLPTKYIEDLEVSTKFEDWITHMRQMATNEPLLLTKAITTGAAIGDARKGTLLRTSASSMLMFKSFPITVMLSHMAPAIKAARKGKLQHLGSVMVGTTILGAASLQLKEIVKGREPKDADNGSFWAAAMMQGGGLGLAGDFILQDASRFGRSPVEEFLNIGGPTGGLVSDIFRATKGNFDKTAGGGDANFARDSFNILKRNVPFSNLWYSRLLIERTFLDNIERAIDPKFDSRMRRLERKYKKEFGQNYWWKKGKLAPEG